MTARELIDAERVRQGLPYLRLSAMAGLNVACVHRFLRSTTPNTRVTLYTVLRLMKALGMDIKQLEDTDDGKEEGPNKQPEGVCEPACEA